MTTTIYKLTDANMRTRNGFQWELGVWKETSGEGDLCGPGWLHCYSDPWLAIFMNPLPAGIVRPRLFRGEAEGAFKDDHGLKQGYTRLRIVEELPVPKLTTVSRVATGILCAKEVTDDPAWNRWADRWLSGEDRSRKAAWEQWGEGAAVESAASVAARVAAWVAARVAASVALASTDAAVESAAARAALAEPPFDLPAIIQRAREVK